jgi:hypothetical protein
MLFDRSRAGVSKRRPIFIWNICIFAWRGALPELSARGKV